MQHLYSGILSSAPVFLVPETHVSRENEDRTDTKLTYNSLSVCLVFVKVLFDSVVQLNRSLTLLSMENVCLYLCDTCTIKDINWHKLISVPAACAQFWGQVVFCLYILFWESLFLSSGKTLVLGVSAPKQWTLTDIVICVTCVCALIPLS